MFGIKRGSRGFSFVEIMVVLLVISIMSVLSAGIFSGPVQFYRARRSIEGLMWDLRKVQQKARSRGYSRNWVDSPGIFGVVIYNNSTTYNGGALVPAAPAVGYSYLIYGPANAQPADSLGGLNQVQLSQVVNLDPSLVFVAAGGKPQVLWPTWSPGPRIEFARDIAGGSADIIPDTAPGLLNMAAPANFLDFQLQDDSGYFRIEFNNQRFIGLRYVQL